jgi:hypothetical protein
MPTAAGLGVTTIHRFTEPRVTPSIIAVTVYTPIPTTDVPGIMRNTNDKPFAEPLPRRFVIDDGGLTRAFTGIDLSRGSALDQKLDAIVARMPKQADGSIAKEDAIEFVKRETNKLIKWTRGSSANDGRDEFDWDKAIVVDRAHVQNVFNGAAYQTVGEPPIGTGQTMTIAPLEAYLDAGEGYCIQKALLAACLLDKVGVPFRIVNGAVAGSPGRSTGHTWLELDDGRVLDPAWSSLQSVTFDHDTHATWFRFGGSYRYANQSYPFMELT